MDSRIWRQQLHLEPPQGWMNDPNGLAYHGGKYHVYFQYAPDSASGKGKKCWGHYESGDLIHWDFTGTVLFPDIAEDRDGVLSGCAVNAKNLDTLHLFYTGNVEEKGDHDYITSGRGSNVIHVQTKDGREMGAKEVQLRNTDYPDFCSCHVRAPKVWWEEDCWNMVLGARSVKDQGCVLFYTSPDLKNWTYRSCDSIPDFGYMWECPDCFTMDGHRYLSVSPQGLNHEEYRFQNMYSSGYFHYDGHTLTDFQEWDMGFDFYAPQTFEAPDGRRILIGWMGIADIPYKNPTEEFGWQHALTLPRELTRAEDGVLLQQPFRELESLRREQTALKNGIAESVSTPFELLAAAEQKKLAIRMNGFLFTCDGRVAELSFLDDAVGGGRTVRKALLDNRGQTEVRMIADTSSVELYLGGGRTVFSTRYFPSDSSITLQIDGCDATVYRLEGMEIRFLGK